ncbi:MAG: lysophospholipid acyltransferase family protein [Planctomycetota bacterium]
MATPGPVMMWTQYLAARAVVAGLTCVEPDWNLKAAGAVGGLIDRVSAKHARRSRENIRRSFPGWPQRRVDQVARASMSHVMKLIVETMHTPRSIHEHNWSSRIDSSNLGDAVALLNTGRPVILVTGHLGNFELLGYALAVLGYDVDAIARPLDNPLVYDWLMGIRRKKGMRIISKFGATEPMVRVMERGGGLGFIADQNAGHKGIFVPFMGRLASAHKPIGLLAQQFSAPIICGYAFRLGDHFRYEVGTADIIYPEQWADQPNPLYYITARYTRALEAMVRMRPEQYWWMHRRWKNRPKHEAAGKPMPGRLRENLEALPWMTPSLMSELEKPVAFLN